MVTKAELTGQACCCACGKRAPGAIRKCSRAGTNCNCCERCETDCREDKNALSIEDQIHLDVTGHLPEDF